MNKKQKPKLVPFRNRKGKVICLPDNLTVEQLTIMGIKVSITPRGTPLRSDRVYVNP